MSERDFERAGDLVGGTVRPVGDTALVEIPHGPGAYSRFDPDASCRIDVHENGRRAVVVELADGDGWFESAEMDGGIEVRRAGAVIVADGATAAVKSERDGRTIVVAVDGALTLRPADGEEVVLRQQAAMLDATGRLGQVVDVTPAQVASEPWVARNRGLEPIAAPDPDPDPEPVAAPQAEVDEVDPVGDEEVDEVDEVEEFDPVGDEVEEIDEVDPVGDEVEEVDEVAEDDPVDEEDDPAGDDQVAATATMPVDPDAFDAEPLDAGAEDPEPGEAYDLDDEAAAPPLTSRRWPRLVMAGILLIAAIALLLPRSGTGGDDGGDDEAGVGEISSASVTAPTTAAPSEPDGPGADPDPDATPETTTAPPPERAEELPRSDAPFENELVSCRRSGGQVAFAGRLTNPQEHTARYRLHVVFTGADGEAVERRQVELEVAAGASEAWEVTSSAGGRLEGGSCDLERVEPLG